MPLKRLLCQNSKVLTGLEGTPLEKWRRQQRDTYGEASTLAQAVRAILATANHELGWGVAAIERYLVEETAMAVLGR
jgi:hypothetical protein